MADLNQEPTMAEHFAASTKSPRAACLEGVRACELYLGLFGMRYSAATVDEYEEAKRCGKQIIVFVEQGDKEPKQTEFLSSVEDYAKGHFRDSYSTPEELYRKIVKGLSVALTAEAPDFSEADQSVLSFGGTLRKDQYKSWLWMVLKPAIKGSLIRASTFVDTTFQEEILEIALDRKVRLFELKLASDFELRGDLLEIRQRDPDTHGSAVVRKMTIDRNGFLTYGSLVTIHGDYKSSFVSFYIDPDIVKTTVDLFFRFAERLFCHVDSSLRVSGFSLGCYLLGTDKHFMKPPASQSSMSMPWAMGTFPDPLLVPQTPLHLGIQELKRGTFYAEEIVAMFRQAFSKR